MSAVGSLDTHRHTIDVNDNTINENSSIPATYKHVPETWLFMIRKYAIYTQFL